MCPTWAALFLVRYLRWLQTWPQRFQSSQCPGITYLSASTCPCKNGWTQKTDGLADIIVANSVFRVGLWRKLSTEELMCWTVVLEKTIESPLDYREIQPVHPKGDQSWVFIGRTDADTETPVLWPPHAKSWLMGKDPDAWRDWGQEEKGTTEDEMAGWHHWLDGHEFE